MFRMKEVKNYDKYLEKCVNVLNLKFVYDTIQMFVTMKRRASKWIMQMGIL